MVFSVSKCLGFTKPFWLFTTTKHESDFILYRSTWLEIRDNMADKHAHYVHNKQFQDGVFV